MHSVGSERPQARAWGRCCSGIRERRGNDHHVGAARVLALFHAGERAQHQEPRGWPRSLPRAALLDLP
eukprot:4376575-Alexandrium_andersonii.AAC.1